MSGAEIVVGAMAVSLLAGGVSSYEQTQAANNAADTEARQVRDQQVQLRLQQNQNSIERMTKLRQVLATEEVTFGERNISMGSGTVRAITQEDMDNFYADENADKLNYASKSLALARQRDLAYEQAKAEKISAVAGFVRQGAGAVMAAYGVPNQSLMDGQTGSAAAGGGADYSGYSIGEQNFAEGEGNQFDLNA